MRLARATSSVGAEQRHAADRAQVQAQRVEAGLDREVQVGGALELQADAQPARALMLGPIVDLARQRAALAGARQGVGDGAMIAPAGRLERGLARGQHLDAVLLQVAQQLLGLLGAQVRILERRGQRLSAHEAALLALADDALKLLHLHHGRLGGDRQTLKLLDH